MNYGFVIDNNACIGCHACSTACKSENEVPLGVYRTWVKYTESGTFPDSRRNFQVTRCNHCANPPCVRICPVSAMYQRDDGIVEFDTDACIGCKGCMQACPYDAIYLDPESHTAAKCHYCSHRVDVGLEPACVVVCPEHAIIAGDIDDPSSEIRRVMSKHDLVVRKPEQGTAPKVFYIEGNQLSLHPTAAVRPEQLVFTDVATGHHLQEIQGPARSAQATRPTDLGVSTRAPATQGLPPAGPLQVQGRMAEHMAQVAYTTQHKVQWHWPIPAYVVTKHIAGGSFLMLAASSLVPGLPFHKGAMVTGGFVGLLATLATLALLLYDLDRPDRFFYLLVRPQWRSWIARAAWILSGFFGLAGVWWALETASWMGWIPGGTVATLRPWLAVATAPFALMTAIYTAFLLAQAEGRDLWQGNHLPWQMTLHAVTFGAGTFVALSPWLQLPARFDAVAWTLFGVGLGLSLVLTLAADVGIAPPSELARQAGHDMVWGRYRRHYWGGGIVLGHLVPLALLAIGAPVLGPVAFVAACVGLFLYEIAYLLAPQHQPNS
ncbi:MAG: polysulfide reductase NrfD [Alphaproteobacteria bacterium]|nr:polysulfide reductase NrfD [Alphaproteobacteria bacterium]